MTGERLLIISPGVPHKSEGASSVLFYHYIEQLNRAGFRILNALLCDSIHEPEEYQRVLATYRQELESAGQFDIRVVRSRGFIRRSPLTIRLDMKSLQPLKVPVEAFMPDIVLCFDLMSAWVARALNCPGASVAWLGDLNFQTGWYHALYGCRERPILAVKVPLEWFRGQLWRRIYRRVLGGFKAVIVSSKSSEVQLARIGISSHYLPYPWPSVPSRGSAPGLEPGTVPTFVFFGNLAALGSRSALHFLVRKLYPKLVGRWGHGGFRIRIAGKGDLPGWVLQTMKARPECEVLGFEDDLDGLLASCHAMLAPIDVPVGNRSRIVTAMAKGSLVIAHKNAALGNPDLVDGETCYLAGTADEFVDRMEAVVTDPARSAQIVDRAREVYNSRFKPEAAFQMLLQVLNKVSGARSAHS
jgi:glycosyltransferase involved in cell wall biosynthesis